MRVVRWPRTRTRPIRNSIGFNMEAAGSAQFGPQGGPIDPMLPADVGQRGLHPLLKAPQPAHIDVGFVLPEQIGDVGRPLAQPILDVLPSLPAPQE